MPDRDDKGHFEPGHNLPGPGRPSLYDVSMNEQARKLALLGLTDEEMAEFFGVARQTLDNWKKDEPAFFAALMEGKTAADANVADSLYRRATGEHVEYQKAYKGAGGEVEIITLKSWQPGDPGAAKLWLTNRRPQNWRDKQEIEHSGAVKTGFDPAVLETLTGEQREQLRSIASAIAGQSERDA